LVCVFPFAVEIVPGWWVRVGVQEGRVVGTAFGDGGIAGAGDDAAVSDHAAERATDVGGGVYGTEDDCVGGEVGDLVRIGKEVGARVAVECKGNHVFSCSMVSAVAEGSVWSTVPREILFQQ